MQWKFAIRNREMKHLNEEEKNTNEKVITNEMRLHT